MPFSEPLRRLINECEKLCVKECCGIEAFDFSPVQIAAWLDQIKDRPTSQAVSEIETGLDDFRIEHGPGGSNEGYESPEDEMNQIFSAEQVVSLTDQIQTNLKAGVELLKRSQVASWRPADEQDGELTEHEPPLTSEQAAFIRALSWRYATKRFDETRTVSPQQLETVLEATNLTATSYGLQPFRFVVVSGRSDEAVIGGRVVRPASGRPSVSRHCARREDRH